MTGKKIKDLKQKFTDYYDKKESLREHGLKLAREISRDSTAIIRNLHTQGTNDITKLFRDLQPIQKKYQDLNAKLKTEPELYYSNFVENYLQEYAEATILLTLIKNNLDLTKLPDPDTLKLPYTTYLLGLADVIGELRRCALDAMLENDLALAKEYLRSMEKLYDIIINLNYTGGVLPLRRKQDVARSLIEKTRSELAVTASEYSLEKNIVDLKNELNSYYKKLVRKN
jgi:translin